GIGAVNGVADLGEENRVRHRRVVEFLGVVVFLHPEGAEVAVRRLVGRNAGGDRPVVVLDAVDRDGHLLRILVDGDGDIGLRGAGGEQHQAGKSNDEGTHVYLWPPSLDCSAALSVPRINMPGMRLWFQRPVRPSLMPRRAPTRRRRGLIGAPRYFSLGIAGSSPP